MTTLTSPHDLLAAIPFLIGYHPTDSLVLVSLKDDAVLMAMRVDYPDSVHSDGCDALVAHLSRNEADGAFIVAYLPEDVTDASELITLLTQALSRANIDLKEALVISHGRWRSVLCEDRECCPEEGRPLPEITSSRIAAEQVSNGKVMPFASEEDLADSLASAPLALDESFMEKVRSAAINAENPKLSTLQRLGAVSVIDLASRFIAGSVGANIESDQELSARVLGALNDIQVRDFALGSHTEATHQVYWQMWRYLLRIAPVGFVAPVATLFAATSYERGEGALAQRALDRAVADDSTYSLTSLLRRVFSAGWPPESFAAMRKELHPKVCAGIFENTSETNLP